MASDFDLLSNLLAVSQDSLAGTRLDVEDGAQLGEWGRASFASLSLR